MKKRILFIDNELHIVKSLSLYMAHMANWHVKYETNPFLVVELASQFIPHLIVLDIDMPKMDGGELAQKLRNDPRTMAIPLIFLSSMILPNEQRFSEGVCYFSKSLHFSELIPLLVKKLNELPQCTQSHENSTMA